LIITDSNENFIKRTYLNTPRFTVDRGGYYLSGIEEYIVCNARNAIKIYSRLKDIKDVSKRFYTITKFTFPWPKGPRRLFLTFYKDISKRHL